MRGLYFTMTAYFRNGYAKLYDDPIYDPFWKKVATAKWPVFWVHSAKSPLGDYSDEMRIFRRFLDRHPGMKHVLVHGIPTSVFADDDPDGRDAAAELVRRIQGRGIDAHAYILGAQL